MKVISFFQLIRWKNLSMLFITQLLFKYVLFKNYNIVTTLNDINFALLVASTISIAGGGYIINDVFDRKTDAINKPKNVLIGKYFSVKEALFYYTLLTLSGIIAGIFISFKIELPYFSIIFVSIAILLFLYSYLLKKVALLGNFTTSFLIGFSIFIINIFDVIPNFKDGYKPTQTLVYNFVIAYTIFSVALNFIREIVKDIEDIDGDFSQNIKTLPILIGRKRTNTIVIILSIVFVISLFTILFINRESNLLLYILSLVFVMLPLLYFITKIHGAKTKSDYHKLSSLLKIIMVFGILTIFVL